MERILVRKHPGSVSVLNLASKSSVSLFSSAKEDSSFIKTRKVLKQRIAQIENDALEQNRKSQSICADTFQFGAIEI
jgi:deoxyhypusine synthase